MPYIEQIDLILVMSVVPGLPAQPFMEEVLPKIKKIRKIIQDTKRDILISVDGGVNLDYKKKLGDVDILVSGSFVTNSANYEEVIDELKK